MIGLWHSKVDYVASDVREALPAGCEERLLPNAIAVRIRQSKIVSQCNNRAENDSPGNMEPGL